MITIRHFATYVRKSKRKDDSAAAQTRDESPGASIRAPGC